MTLKTTTPDPAIKTKSCFSLSLHDYKDFVRQVPANLHAASKIPPPDPTYA